MIILSYMNLDVYQIDAFVSESCKGNTACIISLDNWLSDELLLQISKKSIQSHIAMH